MFVPLAAMWVPTAVGLALAIAILGGLVWVQSRDPGPDADGPDDSEGGGGARRRRPPPPPPIGPVSWQDFERQFAAYVDGRGRAVARDSGRDGLGERERAPNGVGDTHRGH